MYEQLWEQEKHKMTHFHGRWFDLIRSGYLRDYKKAARMFDRLVNRKRKGITLKLKKKRSELANVKNEIRGLRHRLRNLIPTQNKLVDEVREECPHKPKWLLTAENWHEDEYGKMLSSTYYAICVKCGLVAEERK